MDLSPQHLDINIIETVWDHVDQERNKNGANIQRRAVEGPSSSWTIPEDYLPKSFLEGVKIVLNLVIQNIDLQVHVSAHTKQCTSV